MMQQQPIPPERPINVRLSAQQWDFVLRLMQFGVGTLMQDIQSQCFAPINAASEERAADG